MSEDFLDVTKIEREVKTKDSDDTYYVLFTLEAGSVIQLKYELDKDTLDKLMAFYEDTDEVWNKKLRIGEYDLVSLDSVIAIQTISKKALMEEMGQQEARASLLVPGGSARGGPLQ